MVDYVGDGYICDNCSAALDPEASATWELMQRVCEKDVACLCAGCLVTTLFDMFEQASNGKGENQERILELFYKSDLYRLVKNHKCGLH